MDPRDEVIHEAIVRAVEVVLTSEREKTRLMDESLRADRAELEEKERERSMLLREKDRMHAVKDAEEKLVADFLEADGNNKNFHDKAMMDAIVALISRDGGDGSNDGGFGGDLGGNINYLENTQNLDDEGAMMATIEGMKGDGK
ncbi:hypothetical protein CRYUN_Cryun05aG0037200 [Craigia yunnanensis]